MRYLSGGDWKMIRQRLRKVGFSCTERSLYRLHQEALEQARELWKAQKLPPDDREELCCHSERRP